MAKAGDIKSYLRSHKAYAENLTRQVLETSGLQASKEMASTNRRSSDQKRTEILARLLYKDNTLNKELSKNIEKGSLAYFDCAPISYSPLSNESGMI